MAIENDFITENPFAVMIRRMNRIESQNERILEHLQKISSVNALSPDEVLTIEEAAKLLNLTKQTLYGLVSANKIPYSKPTGSRLYFSKKTLLEWLNADRKPTTSERITAYEQQKAVRGSKRKGVSA